VPYIPKRERERLLEKMTIPDMRGSMPGILAFALTKVLVSWLPGRPRYQHFAEAMGVIESLKLELYRRMVAPYEDQKKAENGDVFFSGDTPLSEFGRRDGTEARQGEGEVRPATPETFG